MLPRPEQPGAVLVGAEDVGAEPDGHLFKPATLENFPPGFRADIVRRSARPHDSAGESHLLSFGEFVAYYLLTWSPALWEQLGVTLWPDDFNPDGIAMPEDWRIRFIYEDDRGVGETTRYFDTVEKNLPRHAVGGPVERRDRAVLLRSAAQWLTEQVLVAGAVRVVDAPVPPAAPAGPPRARQRADLHGRRRPRHLRRLELQPAVARTGVHAAARRRHRSQRPDGAAR